MHRPVLFYFLFILFNFLNANGFGRPSIQEMVDPFKINQSARIGDNPFPTNPMNDRARGYLLQGKAQTAVTNFGNFVDIDVSPNGAWGDYGYLYDVSFLAGVPGQSYTSNYSWELVESSLDEEGFPIYSIWESQDAYDSWFGNGDTNYVGILFEASEDFGLWEPDSISRKNSKGDLTDSYQWFLDEETKNLVITTVGEKDPNSSSAHIGLIYPWALRPDLISREAQFDYYDYGPDQEEWTADDSYFYYGANTAESCLTFFNPTYNTDWQAANMARINTHNTDITAGDIFGETYVTDPADTYPILAHSAYAETWPIKYNPQTGKTDHYWPGWWAEDFNINLPKCTNSRKDPNCWETVPGRFISDMDVYMEFDDRWAHRGNQVNTNNDYEQTGYPMGLRVMSEAHSYGVSYAEDILFITVKVRNESGDWCAEDELGLPIFDDTGNPICGDAMVMPDGTKLNRGKGFNYKGVSLGFWVDGVILTGDKYGNYSYWTSRDDYMKYYWELLDINKERLLISMSMIGDYDGQSLAKGYAMDPNTISPGNEFGLVATQLLDSPRATDPVDLDNDGSIDIFPGEPLKMTDWHWLDWYLRPGVLRLEGEGGDCYAGTPGCPQARNKEELFYKLMVGDTVNLSDNEKEWHFHTDNPGTDSGSELNPHFDSLEGIEEEAVFQRPPDGVDPLVIMSCGPFDLPVGREVPFSFCIIFGQDEQDLINNARFAQVMYNSRYQGFTPPTRPKVHGITEDGKVKIYWNNAAESTNDVVTGYSDFEGYKIYKSTDGGETWGSMKDMIYDDKGIFVGWRPFKQYDLSAEMDSTHCIYSNNEDCGDDGIRGHSIKGKDPYFPWFSLGDDVGLESILLPEPYVVETDTFWYMLEDLDVTNGVEVTYSVVAFDMGVEAPYTKTFKDLGNGQLEAIIDTNYSNPDKWADPDGYASLENSKGTTILDRNFIQVYPGVIPKASLKDVSVVPNPYFGRSIFKETEHLRQIRFTNLTESCIIKIFTINGEYVDEIIHNSESSGNAWWDMRTVNNQEVAPGLYIFHVAENGASISDPFIGKFAIIR